MHSTFFPARMSLAVQCAAGFFRVYENVHGCKPITKRFRAAITTKGKRFFGSPCPKVSSAGSSLQKIVNGMRVQAEVPESAPAEEKAGQKRSRLFYEAANVEHYKTAKTMKARALKIDKMHEGVHTKSFKPAARQPTGRKTKWSRALRLHFEDGPCPGQIRLFRRERDKKVRMSLCRQGEKRFLSEWHSSKEDALQSLFTWMKADALQLTRGNSQGAVDSTQLRCYYCTTNP